VSPDGGGAVVETAPAKLNLGLHVLGRRDDGRHDLDSLVAFAALGDRVTARPGASLELEATGPFARALPDSQDNLVRRAADALAHALGRAPGAALALEKNLPVAAGLGGGSADAAACLRALTRLWSASPPAERLASLAAELGSDVTVCLESRAAFVGGAGERVAPAPKLPAAPLVLVNPGVPLPTGDVFAARAGAFSPTVERFSDPPRDAAALAAQIRAARNDLTPGAVARVPAIGACLAELERSAGCLVARMSGSGATCFGLFADDEAATRAAAAIAVARPRWWVAATRLSG
jgi:4-diphosphocytidyl-2-C-methyl-D-erythritol kinase